MLLEYADWYALVWRNMTSNPTFRLWFPRTASRLSPNCVFCETMIAGMLSFAPMMSSPETEARLVDDVRREHARVAQHALRHRDGDGEIRSGHRAERPRIDVARVSP